MQASKVRRTLRNITRTFLLPDVLLVLGVRVIICSIRGGLGFQNKRTHQTVVGALFSTVLDRAEQVGVRKKTAAIFLIGWEVMAGKPKSANSEPEDYPQSGPHTRRLCTIITP
jgi:hypothetical protein